MAIDFKILSSDFVHIIDFILCPKSSTPKAPIFALLFAIFIYFILSRAIVFKFLLDLKF